MKRWKLNLWILWTTQIISLASFGFGLPFIPIYIQELEVLSPEKVKLMTTILTAAPAITMAAMAPVWGYLSDKYGRKLMIMRAMTFAIFVIGGMGLVTNVSQLIILRLLQGLLTGTVTAAIAFISSNTPKDKLVFALGVITSSTFIGFSIGPMFGGVFAELYGYRVSFLMGGGLMGIGALLVLLFVNEDKSTLHKKTDSGNQTFIEKYKTILIPITVIVMLMLFFLRITRTLFAPYLSLFIQENLNSLKGVAIVTGFASAAIGLATGLSSVLISFIAHHFNKPKLITGMLLISLVIAILLTQYDNIYNLINIVLVKMGSDKIISNPIWVFIPIYTLFFLALGGIEPLLTSIAAMNVDSSNRGALFGFHGFVSSLAWFASPVIAGPITIFISLKALIFVLPVMLAVNIFLSGTLKKIDVNESS